MDCFDQEAASAAFPLGIKLPLSVSGGVTQQRRPENIQYVRHGHDSCPRAEGNQAPKVADWLRNRAAALARRTQRGTPFGKRALPG